MLQQVGRLLLGQPVGVRVLLLLLLLRLLLRLARSHGGAPAVLPGAVAPQTVCSMPARASEGACHAECRWEARN